MTDAPERIWIIPIELEGKDTPPSDWPDPRVAEEAVEYVRADTTPELPLAVPPAPSSL